MSNTIDALGQRNLPIQQAIDLAVKHHSAGRLPEAENVLNQILAVYPDQPVALHLLGLLAHLNGKNGIAIDLISRALAIKPDFAEAHCNIGMINQYIGEPHKAISNFRKALEKNPEYAEAYYGLGVSYKSLGNLVDAVSSYRQAITAKPDFALAHNNLGNLLKRQGMLDDAMASYSSALAIKPNYVEALNNIGTVLTELGRQEEAITIYHKALSIRPDYVNLLFNLHTTCYGKEDLELGAVYLEKAVRLAPKDTQLQFFLGMIRDCQGKFKQAEKHFKTFRKKTDVNYALFDSWRYVKSQSKTLPRVFCHTPDGLQMGLAAAKVDGLILEFGVLFGTSIRHISAMTNKEIHGFDGFQGLPEDWHNQPKGTYSTNGELPKVPKEVHLHVGLFENTLPEFLEKHAGHVRFLHVDCDLYSSTRTVLDLLASRIVPGSVIVFDDYFGYPHWRDDEYKAFQESVEEYGWQYDYLGVSLFSRQAVVLIR